MLSKANENGFLLYMYIVIVLVCRLQKFEFE